MSMCSRCYASYKKYADLRGQIISAQEYTSNCISSTSNVNNKLSTIIICGDSINKDDTSNINRNLVLIRLGLTNLISQCSTEMARIANACPGPDHYEQKRPSPRQ